MLKGKKIVIGLTGSIAAYKIPFLIRLLVREGAEVQVVMTQSAADFVTPLTLSTLSKRPVMIHPFDPKSGAWNSHVDLGIWADVMLFAPVTANTIGKMVNGIADNFLVTAYLSAKCPVFIAPAMDLDMYIHPSTKRNIAILKEIGNIIIEPQVGELASGLSGCGRMEEPENMLKILEDFFRKRHQLEGVNVLVSAGPTVENIDAVRFISNHSSGLMGFSLAEEAVKRGANVTLVTGPSSILATNPYLTLVNVSTAAEMYEMCIKHFPRQDLVIMAAAVSDYTPAAPITGKMKKSGSPVTLELSPTEDILAAMGKKKKKGQVLAGFALETDHEVANAKKKLASKNLDLVILNSLKDPGAGFGTTTNKVTMITRSGKTIPGKTKLKSQVASDIMDVLSGMIKK